MHASGTCFAYYARVFIDLFVFPFFQRLSYPTNSKMTCASLRSSRVTKCRTFIGSLKNDSLRYGRSLRLIAAGGLGIFFSITTGLGIFFSKIFGFAIFFSKIFGFGIKIFGVRPEPTFSTVGVRPAPTLSCGYDPWRTEL